MPTKRQRRSQERRPEYSALKRAQLCQGYDMLNAGYGEGMNFDEAAARADWREHRGELIGYWITPHAKWLEGGRFGFANPPPGGPGARPWAWWAFDSPPELQERLAREGVAVIYENIRGVLKRHGMLTAGEDDAEPGARADADRRPGRAGGLRGHGRNGAGGPVRSGVERAWSRPRPSPETGGLP
jgi:hypothetical protein